MSSVTSMRPSIWPRKSGRLMSVGAGEIPPSMVRRQAVAVAGVRTAQVRDQRVPLPIGDREKFRRHDPERVADGQRGAARIGVVAAAQFDRGLDEKAAGIVADRPERIVVDLQALARRLTVDRASHRRRNRRLVGGLGWRDRQPHPAVRHRLTLRDRRWRTRPCRLRPGLAGIKFRFPARAIERVEAGIRRAAGSGKTVGRYMADPRRRRGVLVTEPLVADGLARFVGGSLTGPAQRRILGRDEAVGNRTEQGGGQGLRAQPRRIKSDQRKARQQRAKNGHAPAAARCWTRHHDENTSTNSYA